MRSDNRRGQDVGHTGRYMIRNGNEQVVAGQANQPRRGLKLQTFLRVL